MTLTDTQRDAVRGWLAEGLKLSDVQRRLETEFGVRVTYMEVRFLVDDLKVALKDPEPVKKPEPPKPEPNKEDPKPADPDAAAGLGAVKVSVDAVTRPGAMVSGRATFSDGEAAAWFIDTSGRPGLFPDKKGYRPSPSDMQEFQTLLEQELYKLGF
jgi:hypothetical protein